MKRSRWGAPAIWGFALALLGILGLALARSEQGPIRVGVRAPDFRLTTFEGETWRMADLQGRVVVVNFWASWCEPCEEEAAVLQRVYREYADAGVVFLGVNYADTRPEALAYLERFEITYPNGPDVGTRIAQAFRIRGVPETYIISAAGTVASVKIGPYGAAAELESAIDRALAEGG